MPTPTIAGEDRGQTSAGKSSAAFPSPTGITTTGSSSRFRRRGEHGRGFGAGVGVDGGGGSQRQGPRTALLLLRGEGAEDPRRCHGFWTGAGWGGRGGSGTRSGGFIIGDGDGRSRTRNTQRRCGQRLRREHQRGTLCRPLYSSAPRGEGSDDGRANGDESEGLLFGDPSTEEDFGNGDDHMVVEVDEEDLMEEWEARGLNPEAFDPMVLLQMWEEEDAEVGARRLARACKCASLALWASAGPAS